MAELLSSQNSVSDSNTDSDTEPEPESDFETQNPFCPMLTTTYVNYPDSDSDYSQPDINSLVTDLFASSTPTTQHDTGFISTRDFNSLIFQTELNGLSICNHQETPYDEFGHSDVLGLRDVGFDSDSDMEPDLCRDSGSGVVDIAYGGDDDADIDSEFDEGQTQTQIFWDSFRVDDPRDAVSEERSNSNSVEEELLMLSGVSGEGEFPAEMELRQLERELLAAVNTMESALVIRDGVGQDSYLAVPDSFMYAVEYETLLEQLMKGEVVLRGSPPAARSFVESIPLIELRNEDLRDSCVVCAVCKDEVMLDEKVRKLPCCHYYHDSCIGPWLEIRNTCPVCRYELPTDDPEYELRENSVSSHSRVWMRV